MPSSNDTVSSTSEALKMVLSASGLPSLNIDRKDTLQGIQANLSTIPPPTQLICVATLTSGATISKIPSDRSSTAWSTPSTISSELVAPSLASLINPSASTFDTELQVCPKPSALPSNSLSVYPELPKVLSAVAEVSPTRRATKDITNIPSLSNVGESLIPSHLSSATEGLQASTLLAMVSPSVQGLIKEGDRMGLTSGSIQSKLPSISKPQEIGGVLVGPEPLNLFNAASSLVQSTKLPAIASPLVPPIPGIEVLNEVTPLLQSVRRIPWFQVSILLFLQMVEPLTIHVVSPFTTELIRDVIGPNIGTDKQLEYVAEFFRSMFYLVEASTVLYWSKTSDKVGRKPVILIGLVGSSLSMMCFGVSQSFWGSLVSRSLMSGLNGNAGVIKGMMAETVDAADLARVYAFTPFMDFAGESIGPFINDFLLRFNSSEKPPDNASGQASVKIPNIFLYLFACSVPTMLSIASFFLTLLFLKETVKLTAPISTLFKVHKVSVDSEGQHEGETISIVPGLNIRPVASQAGLAIGGIVASAVARKLPFDPRQPLSIRSLFKSIPVVISLGNFACLSLVDIAFKVVQPLFLANPTSLGGLGLPPEEIDIILSACGVLNGIVQLFFPTIHNHLGSRKTFIYGVGSAIPLFLILPLTNFLAKCVGPGILLWLALGVQIVLPIGFNLSFGAIFICITASSPNPESLGAINGLSQMLANSLRGIAPGMVGVLFALSLEQNYLGGNLVYVVLALIAAVATGGAWYLPHKWWASG